MYFKDLIDIPKNSTKIVIKTNKSGTYVNYEYDRIYLPEKKYTIVKRTTIGKVSDEDNTKMYPNNNYIKYFGVYEKEEELEEVERSSCLKVGSYIVFNKIVKEYDLEKKLFDIFDKDAYLLLDFCIYSIVTEDNVAQYYEDYTYNHPLMTSYMKRYSDSSISKLFKDVTKEKIVNFLVKWNEGRNREEKVYISYDSTSKVCQAGDIDLVEPGYSKDKETEPVINYSIAYDCKNQEALFYENYPGSLTDTIQIEAMIEKAKALKYSNLGFILDRGYFSKKNIKMLDDNEYEFIIMMKGKKDLVSEEVLNIKGSFEADWDNLNTKYSIFGTTIKRKLYEDDSKDRYMHIYFNHNLEAQERSKILNKVMQLQENLEKRIGMKIENPKTYEKYFNLTMGKDKKLCMYKAKREEIKREMDTAGYFVIVTSEEMTSNEALNLYKSRDVSEKLFRADKAFLGNGAYRVESNEAQETKVFVEFIALTLRNKFYRYLKEEMKEGKSNELTVPAAIRELEKIELIKLIDNQYELDHSNTKTQKRILKACKIDSTIFKDNVEKLKKTLKNLSQVKT